MKLAYETPKMKAELFQTNAYCAACYEKLYGYAKINIDTRSLKDRRGNTIAEVTAGEYIFHHSNEVFSLNQNSVGVGQYYYAGTGGSSGLYLEWSEPERSFVLYKEAEGSGFFVEDDGNNEGWWDGGSTLQTNTGRDYSYGRDEAADFQAASQTHNPDSTQFLYEGNGLNVALTDAFGWVSDHCMGRVTKEDHVGTITIINS